MKTFSMERRGYNTAEVDQYVQELQTQLDKKEAKIKEYQQKEEAINQSVVEAKVLANKIVEEAKAEAQTIRQTAVESLGDIKTKTKAMHNKLQLFQKEYNHILQQYLVAVRCSDMVQLFDDLDRFMDQLGMKTEEEPVDIADLSVEERS